MVQVFNKAAQVIQEADALFITAGAGMGVDSGLPDFRGDQGFWKAYPALQGYSFIDMANPEWFRVDAHRAWGFYGHRLNLYRATQPHRGFQLILDWIKSKQDSSFVFTSNVDGQFQKAGFDPESICECHGSIHYWQTLEGQGEIVSADGIELNIDEETVRLVGHLPVHPQLSGQVRPNILMFGDLYWQEERTNAQHRRLDLWLERHKNSKMAIIEMGAGTAIPSVRNEGERLLKRNPNATLIRINPREAQCYTHYADRCVSIFTGALEGLSKIQEAMSMTES